MPRVFRTPLQTKRAAVRRRGLGRDGRSLVAGSVILIVLITILFASVALTAFIEKASSDLLVDAREADAVRLRAEAYSALETTLGVLEDFRLVIGGLRNPNEGWSDPLGFANYQPAEGRTIDVEFIDESSKLSLPKADATVFAPLFKAWGLPQADADKLTDALLGWMTKDYVPTGASSPRPDDYERTELPFDPPARSLRSFSELASIDFAKKIFFDEAGEPTDLYRQFVSTFSLYSFDKANINGGNSGVLSALGIEDASQNKRLQDFLHGTGAYQNQGPSYFKTGQDVATLLGANSPAAQLSTQIAALRIIITVHEGHASFRLNTVVAPQGGAKIAPTEDAQSAATGTGGQATPGTGSSSKAKTPTRPQAVPSSSISNAGSEVKSLNYPFTILEIRENDKAASTPAAAAP
jgi:type II secretion system (T2SS) protein K